MKSKQTTNQTMTHGFATPPMTEQQKQFNSFAQTAFDQADPTIPYYFNNLRAQSRDRYDPNNVYNADYSPEVRDAARYSNDESINQAQGQALREDSFNRKNAKLQALGMSANAAAPIFHQTGGTSVTTSNPGLGGILMGALSAGASVGSAAIT